MSKVQEFDNKENIFAMTTIPNVARPGRSQKRFAIGRSRCRYAAGAGREAVSKLTSHEIEVLEMMAGTRKGEWGAWVGACLEFLSEDGYCTCGPDYQITDKGRTYLAARAPELPMTTEPSTASREEAEKIMRGTSLYGLAADAALSSPSEGAMPEPEFTETLAQWMMVNGFSTGHGDDAAMLFGELAWQVAELRQQAPEAFERGYQGGLGFAIGICDEGDSATRGVDHVKRRCLDAVAARLARQLPCTYVRHRVADGQNLTAMPVL